MKCNTDFGKLKSETEIEYCPIPLIVVTHHHEEWDEPVVDPETGGPTGETEHKTRDWDTPERKLRPSVAECRQMGYLRITGAKPSGPAPRGFHYEVQSYKEAADGESIVRQYALVANPPRRWTKLAIETALAQADMLDATDAYLAQATIVGKLSAARAFSRCDYIEEFYPDAERWSALLDGAAAALGKTREEIDAFLDAIPTEVA